MNRFTIFKQYDAQDSILHFGDARPAANSSISLYLFTQWFAYSALNPFIQDDDTVWALASILKILRGFHIRIPIIARS
jgi:hypothetical protein